MPSNRDLIKAIKEIDSDAKTEDLNNKELGALLKELKAAAYIIAPGKSLTSKRGILGPGDEVTADSFHGGVDVLNAFVKTGHIIKG